MRLLTTIIVHASATPPNMRIGVREIRQWHTEPPRNWSDIGYHFVIRRDGTREEGRPIETIGAHTKGYNSNSIGICMVGGVDDSNKPDANYSLSQYLELSKLIRELVDEHPTIDKLKGHRKFSSMKACPCFDVSKLMEGEGLPFDL